MARRNDWERYGSPYDPNFMGKKPPNFQDMEQRRYQTRGCGDPLCSQCNPDTANDPNVRRNMTDDIRRQLIDMARSGRGSIFEFAIPAFSGFDSYGRSEPDDTEYREAREAVKQWLCEAPDQKFDDIIGNEEALGLLRDAIEAPVKHKKLYKAYGMTMPKGALLCGPPGCGKTMFARAAASEMKRLYKTTEFLSLSGAELQQMWVGATEKQIISIFTFAKLYKKKHGHPLLVFIDEAEVILPDRTGRVRRVAPWEESQVATFLAEMDGIEDSGAFILLATNRPEVIDQAVLRDGRCDFKITVKRPTQEAVEVILRKNFEKMAFNGVGIEDLVFAAVESLFDPHKVLVEFHALKIDFEHKKVDQKGERHFCLEHIVSGAMAASIPMRATRHAFRRDKESGKDPTGVLVEDVLKAVNDLYEENRDLDHAYAVEEFRDQFIEDMQKKEEGKKK